MIFRLQNGDLRVVEKYDFVNDKDFYRFLFENMHPPKEDQNQSTKKRKTTTKTNCAEETKNKKTKRPQTNNSQSDSVSNDCANRPTTPAARPVTFQIPTND